jgi:hypothetical protein
VRAGEGFTAAQQADLSRAVDAASQASGLSFRLYVGALEGGRVEAEGMVAARGAFAADTVLIAVDPGARGLEIVTGSRAAVVVDNRTCGFAALSMTSSFSAGDLVGGIRNGLQILADHARHPLTRHIGRS